VWVVLNVGEKGGGFNGVWKNWVLFKNEDNMLENPNFKVWFFLGRGGFVVGEGGNGYLVLGFGDLHGCGSRACFPTLFSLFCLYFAFFFNTLIL